MHENQKTIENYLNNGEIVEFNDDGYRSVIFKKFDGKFFGAFREYNKWNEECWNEERFGIFTNIKIYKEESNEEKIKRLLKDGVVTFDFEGDGWVISEYWDGRFYGRENKECRFGGWRANSCLENCHVILNCTNIAPLHQ